jgi:hypothetical protein
MWEEVTVSMPSGVTFGRVSSFLDELKEPFPVLTTRHYIGAGGLDPGAVVALIFVFIASQYAQGFFSRAGERHYDALHNEIAELMKRENKIHAEASGHPPEEAVKRGQVPLIVVAGQMQFNFHGQPDAEEVGERLRKAAEKVPELPPERLEPPDYERPQLPLNLFFDEALGSWSEERPG